MSFNDQNDIWSKEEHPRYEDEQVEGLGFGGWLVAFVVVLPWLVGVGVIVSYILDL